LAVFLAAIVLAAALRFPRLASRPMHADEAVNADKFGSLLEGGRYAYDPGAYHGPSLYYLTLPSAWLRGARSYASLDEITLRSVPALLGVALVAAHLGARSLLGTPAAALAALLCAISPALVFYSRYFIHETLLVFLSFVALLAAGRYVREPGPIPALAAGVCVGSMHATKETAALALLAMLLAFAATALIDRRRGTAPAPRRSLVRGRHLAMALAASAATSSLLFSSFSRNPGGVLDSLRTYTHYAALAGSASPHVHAWDYYLRLLIHSPAQATPVWTEGLIVGLAAVGAAAGWSRRGIPGADARMLRFLGFYVLVLLALYSAIPYKTPWCVLGALHGMVLLAGAGAAFLVGAFRARAAKALVCALLVSAASQLGWQAFSASFRFAADPRNPYVYAHTGNDVFVIARRVTDLAEAHPDAASMPVHVVGRDNLWPLPWYLRRLSRVSWWNGVSDEAAVAPVVLVTPEMEPALVRRLYDVPPPGERELYVGIFEQPVELRPRLELRGYAARSLWEEYRRRAAP
jgi:uncharacterized protein (TIGR03663 family)